MRCCVREATLNMFPGFAARCCVQPGDVFRAVVLAMWSLSVVFSCRDSCSGRLRKGLFALRWPRCLLDSCSHGVWVCRNCTDMSPEHPVVA